MLKSYEFKFNWTSCTFVKSANPTQSFLTPPWVLITVAGRTLQRPPAGSLPSTPFKADGQQISPTPPGILLVLPILTYRTEEISLWDWGARPSLSLPEDS